LAFNRLDLKANLSEGVASLESARLDTSDGTLNLAGIVPFVDRSLALSGEVIFHNSQPETPEQQPQAGAEGQPAPAPAENATPAKPPLHFFVGGSWDRPFISPSSTGLGQ
jgi:AsmA protein